MKTWMKILMWSGLTGGIAFFAGWQMGKKSNDVKHENEMAYSRGYATGRADEIVDQYESSQNSEAAMDNYRGDTSEEPKFTPVEDTNGDTDGDEFEIPQYHPQYDNIYIVTEEEYCQNEEEYDYERLLYYEDNNQLYSTVTNSVIENPDEVVGIGTLMGFDADPNNPVDVIYVRNDTISVYFRIERFDSAWMDIGPGEDDYDEES